MNRIMFSTGLVLIAVNVFAGTDGGSVLGPDESVSAPSAVGPSGTSSVGIERTGAGTCTAADSAMGDNNGDVGCPKKTDIAPQGFLIRSQPAFGGGTQTASSVVLAGGQDETKCAIDGADPSVSCAGDNDTITVTVINSNGASTATTLTEGTQWTASASVATTCASLAAAVDAIAGVSASCTSPNVLFELDPSTAVVTLTESTAGCTTVAVGTPGGVLTRDGNTSFTGYGFLSNPATGFNFDSGNVISVITNGAVPVILFGSGVRIASTTQYLFGSASTANTGSSDTGLMRSAAGRIRVTNGSSGDGRFAVTGAVIDVGTTCDKGETLIDIGGATVEICVCTATDTLRCVPTATTNPAD